MDHTFQNFSLQIIPEMRAPSWAFAKTSSTLSWLTFPNRHSHLCSIGFAVCWKILSCENAIKIVVLHLSCVTSFQALTIPVLALRLLASEERQRVGFGKTKWPCNTNTPVLARPNGHAALIPLVVPCPLMSVQRDASRRRRGFGWWGGHSGWFEEDNRMEKEDEEWQKEGEGSQGRTRRKMGKRRGRAQKGGWQEEERDKCACRGGKQTIEGQTMLKRRKIQGGV